MAAFLCHLPLLGSRAVPIVLGVRWADPDVSGLSRETGFPHFGNANFEAGLAEETLTPNLLNNPHTDGRIPEGFTGVPTPRLQKRESTDIELMPPITAARHFLARGLPEPGQRTGLALLPAPRLPALPPGGRLAASLLAGPAS
eukprot:12598273-Heterocapsa_arctica.AAC.1